VTTSDRPEPAARLTAVDALRGAVMVIMALDHTRDFFHAGAMSFSPEDLARTTPILFFTRWITHICAPVFLFTAGLGAFLRLDRPGATKAQLSRFLLTRGVWLILIELTVMRLAFNFSFAMRYPMLLLVLWALGVSMIALAALIYLPRRVLAAASLAVIILHNTLDSVQASQFGAFGGVWNVLHQQGVFVLGGIPVVAGYPVLPWIAVMALGFCVGPIFRLEPHLRHRLLLKWGTLLIIAFVLLRAVNVYGDPAPWSVQPSATYTLLSFLRTTKYPPSLDFLLMTIGPALLALAWFDRRGLEAHNPLVVIGRVPFFYYVTHFWALHVLVALMAWLRYGGAAIPFLLSPVPSMGGSRDLFPPDFGYPLWVVYLVWIGIVVAIYPFCRWFAGVKARRREWWLSYL
jgi:uncharacterized membrane protein